MRIGIIRMKLKEIAFVTTVPGPVWIGLLDMYLCATATVRPWVKELFESPEQESVLPGQREYDYANLNLVIDHWRI